MASSRRIFVRNMYLAAFGLVTALGTALVAPLWYFYGRDQADPAFGQALVIGVICFLLFGGLVAVTAIGWARKNVLRPLGNTVVVADRVARGDLSVAISPVGSERADILTYAVGTMLRELRSLVSAIRGSAQEAASMAQQISSSTEQMSASTQEVSGTCNELTERATRQASLVRSAADDAGRILAIAEALAASAGEAAARNAGLARLARDHRDELDISSVALQRLAEEIEDRKSVV